MFFVDKKTEKANFIHNSKKINEEGDEYQEVPSIKDNICSIDSLLSAIIWATGIQRRTKACRYNFRSWREGGRN